MKTLRRISAEALARHALVLDSGACRDVFEDFVRSVNHEDTAADQWIELAVRDTDAFGDVGSAAAFLAEMCRGLDPAYPWQTDPGVVVSATTVGWELWCFSVARWVRHNDVSCVTSLPISHHLDHRHAYALSGPSAHAMYLVPVLHTLRYRIPGDWLLTLVSQEALWHRGLFIVSAMSEPSPRARARKLHDALSTAARLDNHEAVLTACRIAELDSESGPRFWRLVEVSQSYRDIIGAYGRLHRFSD